MPFEAIDAEGVQSRQKRPSEVMSGLSFPKAQAGLKPRGSADFYDSSPPPLRGHLGYVGLSAEAQRDAGATGGKARPQL